MPRILFVFLTILVHYTCSAQRGELICSVRLNHHEGGYTDQYQFQLFKNDTLIGQQDTVKDYEIKFGLLVPGKYSLKVLKQGVLQLQYYNIQIQPEKITRITVAAVGYNYSDLIKTDSTQTGYEEVTFPLLFGMFTESGPSPFSFPGSISIGSLYSGITTWRYAGLGAGIGYSYRHTQLANDSMLTQPYISKRREHYKGLYLSYALFARLNTFNAKRLNNDGCKLDVGVTYNFPILFRHIWFDGNTKVVDRFIHKYSELALMARIGYKFFTLMAEYNLTDNLILGYPELPKFKLGVCFTIIQ